jgi:rod shape-determining protein MreC
MFSKKMAMIMGVALLVAVNIVVLSITSRDDPSRGIGGGALSVVAPFQSALHRCIEFFCDKWENYFFLVLTAHENQRLRAELGRSVERNEQMKEIELSNQRLRKLLDFRKAIPHRVLAAEVIGKDPSPWFRSIMIDKGEKDGLKRGLPVVVPEGVAGQVTDVSAGYAKVMLIIDRTSAVDALVQRTRSRGIVQGDFSDLCLFKYVLRKSDIQVGDTVISSGLDGVFPKGQRIGRVSEVVQRSAGVFQDVVVTPFVDFEKLEYVLVVLDPPERPFVGEP